MVWLKNDNTTVTFNQIISVALIHLMWKGFQDWIEEHYTHSLPALRYLIEGTAEIHAKINNQRLSAFRNNTSIEQITVRFAECQDKFQNTRGPLASFWMSYLDLVEILLALIGALREGNWVLHLLGIRSMILWYFAYEKQNYARYLSRYHGQMT